MLDELTISSHTNSKAYNGAGSVSLDVEALDMLFNPATENGIATLFQQVILFHMDLELIHR